METLQEFNKERGIEPLYFKEVKKTFVKAYDKCITRIEYNIFGTTYHTTEVEIVAKHSMTEDYKNELRRRDVAFAPFIESVIVRLHTQFKNESEAQKFINSRIGKSLISITAKHYFSHNKK